jgi:Flp pilus assembly protein TadD
MIFRWFDAHEAEKAALELADRFAPKAGRDVGGRSPPNGAATSLQDLLRRADADARLGKLNLYKKARFANSFKWRLLENGIEPKAADEVTQSLIVHLYRGAPMPDGPPILDGGGETSYSSEMIRDLLRRADKAFAEGDHEESIRLSRELIERHPTHAEALNNLGASLCQIGEYVEAEQRFREAISATPNHVEAACNLGNVLRLTGDMEESEVWLRRALKLKPNYIEARTSLGFTLMFLDRLRDARARFEKVLKAAPRHADALLGLGLIAKLEGRFSEAETFLKRALEARPRMPTAWAGLATLKRMTPEDGDWLRVAKELVGSDLEAKEEADLHFAIGKYHDDIGEFDEAFQSFKAGNALLKVIAPKYEREARDEEIEALIRHYSGDLIAALGEGGSASITPVFVVGMPRSGTSLTEQILASHPSVKGVGELDFWFTAIRKRETAVRQGLLDLPTRKKLANEYLQLLKTKAGDTLRIVDKATVNSDTVGVIHSVFPNAQFIYMKRDPIDTCLSCYFQQFVAAMNFSTDLSDLAHYYKGHRRLIEHWQSVIPEEKLLIVPYEELVADQEGWTRKMLDFLGLEWNDCCLSFHETQRAVVTASAWQVRQKIYTRSVGRWHGYKKFIGPLRALRN